MNPELVKAYQTTNYFIEGVPQPIRIGEALDFSKIKAERDALVNTIAFISAYNPYSKPLTNAENVERAKHLVYTVKDLNIPFLHGYGEDPNGQWPREYSLAILNISMDRAQKLASQFEQNAFVWVMRDKPAELIILIKK